MHTPFSLLPARPRCDCRPFDAAPYLIAALTLGAHSPAGSAPLFAAPFMSFDVAGSAGAFAVADINGDGHPDVVMTNTAGATVSVLLGNGDGTFQPALTINGGAATNSVAIGDFNSDGHADVVVSHTGGPLSDSITVLIGHGDGTFEPAVQYASGIATSQVIIGDFDGDGHPDLAAAVNPGPTGGAAILLGNGDGSFRPPVLYSTGALASAIAASDLNGDGSIDLALIGKHPAPMTDGAVSVLLNQGDGTFVAGAGRQTNVPYTTIRLADLNSDGRVDAVVASSSSASGVATLLGGGDGSFAAPVAYPVGLTNCIAVADVNGDGAPDVLSIQYNRAALWVMLGTGSGDLGPLLTFDGGPEGVAIEVADVDGDGRPDLLKSNGAAGTLSVCLGYGNGSFGAVSSVSTLRYPTAIAVGDLNGDGAVDIITPDTQGTTASQFMGVPNGAGSFHGRHELGVPAYPMFCAIANLDGDGKPDLVSIGSLGTVTVWRGYGDGGFYSPTNYPVQADSRSFAIGDLNGDGIPDIAAIEGNYWTISILLGNGDGTFAPAIEHKFSVENPYCIAIGDLDGDGHPDLVVSGDQAIAIYRGHGDGSFDWSPSTPVWANPSFDPTQVALADLNGDGHLDVLAVNSDIDSVSVWLGNGDCALGARAEYRVGRRPSGVTVADLNGDSHPDVVVSCQSSFAVSVLLGDGSGSLGSRVDYGAQAGPVFAAASDLNHDGRPDLLVACYAQQTVVSLLNTGGAAIVGVPTPSTSPAGVRLRWLSAQPNPSSRDVIIRLGLPRTTRVDIEILDASGRRIRALDAAGKAGAQAIAWDGRDDHGRLVSDGVYFARARVGGETVTGKLVRIR
jgi:hypothetical protein